MEEAHARQIALDRAAKRLSGSAREVVKEAEAFRAFLMGEKPDADA